MADRLIQILVPAEREVELRELIKRVEGVEPWHDPSDTLRLFSVQMPAERIEAILDPFQERFCKAEGFRAVVVPVEASLPRHEEPGHDGVGNEEAPAEPRRASMRVSREELYADLSGHTRVTPVYMIMVVLSAIVAAVGLARNSPAIVIGAMVMAPLLGPNMAMSLATTLGDAKLAARALRANLVGLLLATLVALISGIVLDVDPALTEIASRTEVGAVDLVVALAAGIAGALAFTTGVPTSLVGVVVAVALLPPLVLFAMLDGCRRVWPVIGSVPALSVQRHLDQSRGCGHVPVSGGESSKLVAGRAIEEDDPQVAGHLGRPSCGRRGIDPCVELSAGPLIRGRQEPVAWQQETGDTEDGCLVATVFIDSRDGRLGRIERFLRGH